MIQTTGPNEGPRAPGAPSVNAGADQYVDLPAGTNLNGAILDPSGSATIKWKLYSGPGAVTIANVNAANTSVTFNKPGTYTFMLSADDFVHAVAYDAVVVNVRLSVSVASDHNDLLISFPSATGQTYRLEQTGDLNSAWTIVMNNISGTGSTITLRLTNALSQPVAFYRIVSL